MPDGVPQDENKQHQLKKLIKFVVVDGNTYFYIDMLM
jgi:hypothetical protein